MKDNEFSVQELKNIKKKLDYKGIKSELIIG
jgi:hypothetical protein